MSTPTPDRAVLEYISDLIDTNDDGIEEEWGHAPDVRDRACRWLETALAADPPGPH